MTRTVLVSVLIGVIAIIAITAAVHPILSTVWIERLHIAGWALGLADVLVIAISFLTEGK